MISEFQLVFLVDLHSRLRAELAAARGKRRRRRRRDRNYQQIISQRINAGDVGIYTCNGLMMHTKKHLTGAKVERICDAKQLKM
ncbi:hypothetical protein NL676_029500 [Syzygium grande]|nr:hypothetical protein NL676_029500 [Syzygium grande]